MEKNFDFLQQELLHLAIEGMASQKPVLVYGAFGSGKTTFVDKLIDDYCKEEPTTLWVRFDFEHFGPETFESLDSLWAKIAAILVDKFEKELTDSLQRQVGFGVSPQTIMVNLVELTFKKLNNTLLMVFENVHRMMDRPFKDNFFDFLRSLTQESHFRSSLRVVVSMISDIEEVNYLGTASSFTNVAEKIHLTNLDDEQISYLLNSHDLLSSPETVKKIQELVGGNLYLIGILLDYFEKAPKNIDEILSKPEAHQIFNSGLQTIGSLVSTIGGGPTVLEQFKSEGKVSIQNNNLNKNVFDTLAKIGVLSRENKITEITYSIQGSVFKEYIDRNF